MPSYELETFAVGAFQCNCTILINPETSSAMVIDPGDDLFTIEERLEHHGLWVSALWHTHAHIDHIGATKSLFEICSEKNRDAGKPAPVVYLHEADRWLYENVDVQAKFLGMHAFDIANEWTKITDGQGYPGFSKVKALHTPGHTPGSCCLHINHAANLQVPRSFQAGLGNQAKAVLISGDTLFRQSIGRTDLWGGDAPTLLKSIRAKLLSLNAESIVIPGHGPLTTVQFEKEKNPFLK